LENKIANWVDMTGELTDYYEVYKMQERFAKLRSEGIIRDTILLCQHNPVISFGGLKKLNSFTQKFLDTLRFKNPGADEENLHKIAVRHLSNLGITFSVTKRGGGSSYIGPGQLVVYPIVDYTKIRDVSTQDWYKDKIDKIMKETLSSFRIDSKIVKDAREGRDGRKDLWWNDTEGNSFKLGGKCIVYMVYQQKISVAYHGFQLNVTPESTRWCHYINLCGYSPSELRATSMSDVAGRRIKIDEVKNRILEVIKNKFGYSNINQKHLSEIEVANVS
jgi:lipoate-protein ligase B